jgi:hypothetical protein
MPRIARICPMVVVPFRYRYDGDDDDDDQMNGS